VKKSKVVSNVCKSVVVVFKKIKFRSKLLHRSMRVPTTGSATLFTCTLVLFATAFVRGHRVLAVWSTGVLVASHSRIHTFDITALAVVASLLAHTPCPGIAASIGMLTL